MGMEVCGDRVKTKRRDGREGVELGRWGGGEEREREEREREERETLLEGLTSVVQLVQQ
jgi:hypothetical protein